MQPRRGADRVPRVILREAHPVLREFVQVGRLNLLLAVAAEHGVTQIVGKDEDDVGPARLFAGDRGLDERGGEREGDEQFAAVHGSPRLSWDRLIATRREKVVAVESQTGNVRVKESPPLGS
jgi:hypothetical protein